MSIQASGRPEVGPAEADERHAEPLQQLGPGIARFELGQHERVDAAVRDQAADVVPRIFRLGNDQDSEVLGGGGGEQRLQERHHDQIGRLELDRRHQVGQPHRPPGPHAAGPLMRLVAELLDRFQDPDPGRLANPPGAVQHVRHGGLAHPGGPGHVQEGETARSRTSAGQLPVPPHPPPESCPLRLSIVRELCALTSDSSRRLVIGGSFHQPNRNGCGQPEWFWPGLLTGTVALSWEAR